MALWQVHSRLIHAENIHTHPQTAAADQNVQIKWKGNAFARSLARPLIKEEEREKKNKNKHKKNL